MALMEHGQPRNSYGGVWAMFSCTTSHSTSWGLFLPHPHSIVEGPSIIFNPKTSSQQGEKLEIATVQKPTFWRAKIAQIWYWTVKSNGESIGMNLKENLGALATPKPMGKPSFCSPENQWRIWVIHWQNGEKSKCGCWNRGWVCLINPVKAEISGS